MKKLILALGLLATPSMAGEWAFVDLAASADCSKVKCTVTKVIEAPDYATIINRDDGPWQKTYSKVGVGWTWSGSSFSAITSTYTNFRP